MSDEELHLMEVRVTLELPTELFTEYHGLKSRRKLTDRVQTAVIDYEERQKEGSGGGDSRMESAIVNLTEIVGKLAESQEADRKSRDEMLEKMVDRIEGNERSMMDMFEKMMGRMEKLEQVDRVVVSEPVVTKAEPVGGVSNDQMMQMMQMIASGMAGNNNNNNSGTNQVVQNVSKEVEVVEKAPSAPDKKSLNRLNSMMDV